MNKLLKISAAALLAAALTTPAASAQVYADIGIGTADVDTAGDFTTLTAHVGYEFHEYFGVEGEVVWGLDDDAGAEIDNTFGIFGVLTSPEYNGFEVFGRLGFSEAQVSFGGATFSADGVAYGLGAKYFFNDTHGVRLDYTRYDYESGGADAETDYFAIAYAHKF